MEDALPLAPGTAPSRRAEGLIYLSSCPAPPRAALGRCSFSRTTSQWCCANQPLLCSVPSRLCSLGTLSLSTPSAQTSSSRPVPTRLSAATAAPVAGKRVQVLGSPSPFLRTAPTRGESSRLGHHAQRGDPWGVPHPSSLVPCPLSLVPRCRDRTAHSRHATDSSQASR